jgi:outer membrane murein-binding lipoprotein Lpp
VFIDATCSRGNLPTEINNLSTEINNLPTEINNLSTEINNLSMEKGAMLNDKRAGMFSTSVLTVVIVFARAVIIFIRMMMFTYF